MHHLYETRKHLNIFAALRNNSQLVLREFINFMTEILYIAEGLFLIRQRHSLHKWYLTIGILFF